MRVDLSRRSFIRLAGLAGAVTSLGAWQSDALSQNLNPKFFQTATLTEQQLAARFLSQATLGANLDLINQVTEIGIEAWIDSQFDEPAGYLQPVVQNFHDQLEEGDDSFYALVRWGWWQQAITAPDLLRQRIAFALSEIFVISTNNDELINFPEGVANYYDMLLRNSFGNFRDLLFDVTMHPCMGYYLSHLRNRKANPDENRYPDENYAREVMQLFSIGLYQLNQDGTRKVDEQGNFIPTYTNQEITEFAKIFTGLTYNGGLADFDEFFYGEPDYTSPMVMFEGEHEPSEKRLLNGAVIPGGQSGMEDINEAIDNLFYHDNVGPFIGRLLIQRLVKSNPTPDYISRVAATFADNGDGGRGDMRAVIKAILLDPEAREISFMDDPSHGMLREPIVRYTHLLRALNVRSSTGQFRNYGWYSEFAFKQQPLASPTVFNFFLPDYQPLGPLSDAGLVSPEFQITTSFTAIAGINFFGAATLGRYLMDVPEGDEVALEFEIETELAQDVERLVDHLDLLLTYGKLSPGMKAIIRGAVVPIFDDLEARVLFALNLITISPEYAVLK